MNLTTTQRFSNLTNQLFKDVRSRSNSLYVGIMVLAKLANVVEEIKIQELVGKYD